jgi:energy-converting hydrogenase Eha subunit C
MGKQAKYSMVVIEGTVATVCNSMPYSRIIMPHSFQLGLMKVVAANELSTAPCIQASRWV